MLHFRSCPPEAEHADTGESGIRGGRYRRRFWFNKKEKKKNLCGRLTKSGRKGLCPWGYMSQAVIVCFP